MLWSSLRLTRLLFALSLYLINNICVAQKYKDRPRYRTAYACEGSQLQIVCEEGTLIHLIRANYGRFSISICNEHGNLDWSVDCTSQRSYYVIANSCGMKKSCSLSALSSLFDDPCPGTLKYLEAHYQCVPESSSSSLSTVKPPFMHTLVVPPIKALPSNATPPTSLQLEPANDDLIPSLSPPSSSIESKGHNNHHDNTLLIRPPIIVPLTQRTSTTTTTTTVSPDNLIPGEKEKDNAVTISSLVSVSSISSASIPSVSSPSASSTTKTTTTSTTTRSPSIKTRAFSTTAKTRHNIGSTSTTPSPSLLLSPSPVSDIIDNSIFGGHSKDNIESETMGSIGGLSNEMSDSSYCRPLTFRDIRWPPTRIGSVTTQQCPPPTHGSAKWECVRSSSITSWLGQPDLSDCTSLWVHSLRSRVESGDSVMSVANELAQRTRSSRLYGGDIIQTINVLQNLVTKMGSSVGDITEEKRHQLVKDLIQSVVEVSSNILENKNREAWFDINVHSRRGVASQLIHGLENAALLLAATQSGQFDFNKAHTNVLVSVRLVDAKVTGVREMHFPTEDTVLGTAWMVMQESLTLPLQTSITSSSSKPGVLKVVFLAYRNVQDFLTPLNISSPLSSPSSSPSSPSVSSSIRRVINSKVMTLSLVGETNNAFNVRLAQPIQLQFKHIMEENISNPQCVYWDYNISEWSSDGCWVLEHNTSYTVCNCNHLTSFALLMDINSGKAPAIVSEDYSQYIVYIGCIISVAFLTLTLAVVLFIYCFTKNDKVRDSVNDKLMSGATWLPECLRRKAKPPPPDTTQTSQTAHLFSLAANGGAMSPPSPMIRASGHHHGAVTPNSGSLQQLSLPYHYWNTKSGPPQYEDHKSAMRTTLEDNKQLLIAKNNMNINNTGFITQGLPSITPDVHLVDSSSYQQYSPFTTSKSLNRRSLRASVASLDRHHQYLQQKSQHQLNGDNSVDNSCSNKSFAAPNTMGCNHRNTEHKSNVIYGHKPSRREIIYPGKHGFQIASSATVTVSGRDTPPMRPPLPDHIYECIDEECYCFTAAQQRADYRTNKFYREFESPSRVMRAPHRPVDNLHF